jgi:hypothetical protein
MATAEVQAPQFSISSQQKSARGSHRIIRALIGGRGGKHSFARNSGAVETTRSAQPDRSAGRLRLLPSCASVTPGDLVRWRGILAEVTDVAHLGGNHDHVVLRRLDRRALPISMPLSDLEGAQAWRFAGAVQLDSSDDATLPC